MSWYKPSYTHRITGIPSPNLCGLHLWDIRAFPPSSIISHHSSLHGTSNLCGLHLRDIMAFLPSSIISHSFLSSCYNCECVCPSASLQLVHWQVYSWCSGELPLSKLINHCGSIFQTDFRVSYIDCAEYVINTIHCSHLCWLYVFYRPVYSLQVYWLWIDILDHNGKN